MDGNNSTNMEITCKDLVARYTWEEIEPMIPLLYPVLEKSIAEYKEAYQKFSTIVPIKSQMRIIIEQNELPTGELCYEVYGKDGTLVKEVFRHENARKRLKNILEQEQGYNLSYTDWAKIAGMSIDSSTLATFPEKDIAVHVLILITERWHSDEQALRVIKEIRAINEGQERNTVRKEISGKDGFLQVWSEKEDGVFHGKYTVYWEDKSCIVTQGIIVDGNKEGIWTYWEKNGKIKEQIRYECDREIEKKSESPWSNDAEDQK
jgi:antitoxin component YwqK of YwqJK toxin-antitoxin module